MSGPPPESAPAGEPARPGRCRVAHLIKGLGRGGAEGLLPQTIRARGEGFDYAVGYFLPWKNALVAEVEAAGAPVTELTARNHATLLLRVSSVARWLRRMQADVVHAHLPLAGVVARLAGRIASVPVVYTEHNLQERYHPLTRRANLATWHLQSHAIAVSAEVAASIRRHAGDRLPVTVVLNGIEVPPAGGRDSRGQGAGIRRRWGIASDAPLVGTVAVLRKQKRLDHWLEAARRIAEALPEARFLVVGDGSLRGELEALAAMLGICDRIVFTGLQEDVPPFLAALDLYLMSSEFEGLPLALLEAMAAGLPVVATPVGGIPEVIEDGRNGLLVPFGDPAALARAALDLLANPTRRERFGGTGRATVEARFGIRRMAAELEEIYRRVATR